MTEQFKKGDRVKWTEIASMLSGRARFPVELEGEISDFVVGSERSVHVKFYLNGNLSVTAVRIDKLSLVNPK